MYDSYDDEEHNSPLDKLPYAREVSKLIHLPGALDRWRQHCLLSIQGGNERRERLKTWQLERDEYPTRGWNEPIAEGASPPSESWVRAMGRVTSPDGTQTAIVEAWVPPEYADEQEPFVGGPLPFTRDYALTLADCYFVLALIHDCMRRDAALINPFDSTGKKSVQDYDSFEALKSSVIWIVQARFVAQLGCLDSLTLDTCFAQVRADLETSGEAGSEKSGSNSAPLDETAYRPASEFIDEDRFPYLKAINAALKANPWIRWSRPIGQNGKEIPNRLLIHAGDWHKFRNERSANPLDAPAGLVEAVLAAEERKAQIQKQKDGRK
jgi:hypothetical protein